MLYGLNCVYNTHTHYMRLCETMAKNDILDLMGMNCGLVVSTIFLKGVRGLRNKKKVIEKMINIFVGVGRFVEKLFF